jgi:hypothetical protein
MNAFRWNILASLDVASSSMTFVVVLIVEGKAESPGSRDVSGREEEQGARWAEDAFRDW